MNNQTLEVIDSSGMTVLSGFDFIEEKFNSNNHFAIGVKDENVLVKLTTNTGWEAVTFLYERANHRELIARTEDVFAGKLREQNIEYYTIRKGRDVLVIGITETFPHTSFKPIVSFNLTNSRRVKLDKRESNNWDLYMSVETGKLFLAEMKRIKNQVVS